MITLSIAAITPADPPIRNMFIIDEYTNAILANPLIKPTIKFLMLVTPFIIGVVSYAKKRKSPC